MFNPKTPLQAGAIFAAGILFIAWTTLDIHRVSRQNEQPLTEEQLLVLRHLRNESLQKSASMPLSYAAKVINMMSEQDFSLLSMVQ